MEQSETYCTQCHGRGLDKYDRTCTHCHGTGIEPSGTYEYKRDRTDLRSRGGAVPIVTSH